MLSHWHACIEWQTSKNRFTFRFDVLLFNIFFTAERQLHASSRTKPNSAESCLKTLLTLPTRRLRVGQRTMQCGRSRRVISTSGSAGAPNMMTNPAMTRSTILFHCKKLFCWYCSRLGHPRTFLHEKDTSTRSLSAHPRRELKDINNLKEKSEGRTSCFDWWLPKKKRPDISPERSQVPKRIRTSKLRRTAVRRSHVHVPNIACRRFATCGSHNFLCRN